MQKSPKTLENSFSSNQNQKPKMSDNIPFELQIEIMKRLPVKSLVQFRSVSKSWKSVIDSSRFIKDYSSQQHHLLVRYDQQLNLRDFSMPSYVSIVDDETFPHQKVSLTLPELVSMFQYDRIIGSSHGLLCLYGCHGNGNYMAVVWNIAIRKAVAVPVPNVGDRMISGTVLGFGVCAETTDPKIVKITYVISRLINIESIPDSSIPWQVEVFTLSTGAWRRPYCTDLPRTSIQLSCLQVFVDGSCYWLATDRSTIDAGFEYEAYNLIISFHMTSEEFGEVNLPDSLVYDGSRAYLRISNLRESLVVLDHDTCENVFDVWLMAGGVSKSFTKLFTIYSLDATLLSVPAFLKSGEPVIEIADDDADPRFVPSLLAVYEPKSKHMSNLGINGTGSFYVHSLVETLLLLDQPEAQN